MDQLYLYYFHYLSVQCVNTLRLASDIEHYVNYNKQIFPKTWVKLDALAKKLFQVKAQNL